MVEDGMRCIFITLKIYRLAVNILQIISSLFSLCKIQYKLHIIRKHKENPLIRTKCKVSIKYMHVEKGVIYVHCFRQPLIYSKR